MSSKKPHQHFIPRSYLKNFGFKTYDKTFIYAKLRDGEIKKYSIRDICVEKNLYTLPVKDGENKFFLENFYAENIDSVYPEIYKILVDDNVTEIDESVRHKIIFVCLSLYFRTPKYLRLQNKFIEHALQNLQRAKDSHTSIDSLNFYGKNFDLTKHTIDEIRTELKKDSKIQFLMGHLDLFQEFIVFLKHHVIGVNKVVDQSELISCDNPVNISNSDKREYNLFDPENIIKFPLNSKYYLVILPNWTNEKINYIFRAEVLSDFTLTTNFGTQRNAEDWLIGTEKSLENHFIDQEEYRDLTPKNLKWLDEVKIKATLLTEAADLFEKYGIWDYRSINKIKELKENPITNREPQFQKMLILLKEKGVVL